LKHGNVRKLESHEDVVKSIDEIKADNAALIDRLASLNG
jgi:hypothetical protein